PARLTLIWLRKENVAPDGKTAVRRTVARLRSTSRPPRAQSARGTPPRLKRRTPAHAQSAGCQALRRKAPSKEPVALRPAPGKSLPPFRRTLRLELTGTISGTVSRESGRPELEPCRILRNPAAVRWPSGRRR